MNLNAWARRLPWSIVLFTLLLIAIGLVAIARAEQLASANGRLFRQQVVFAALAVVVLFGMTLPGYRRLCRYSYALLFVSLVLLIVVFFFPRINGAHRWLRVGSIGVQPSELAKVAFVLALSRWLMHRENYRRLQGLIVPLLLTFLPVILVLREPDLGTALVFLPVLFAMLFAAGARVRDLAVISLTGVVLLPMLWSQMSREQKSRVTAVITQTGPSDMPNDDQYHLHRAKQMIAMGGTTGTFFSNDDNKYPRKNLVPAAATDSIICVLVERFGLVGVLLTLLIYFLLIGRCLSVGRKTQEPFGRLVTVGIASLLGVQVLVNTAMMVGLLPITGLSLPLISYGGSGLVANATALGLVLNIGLRPGYEVAGEPFRFVASRRAA